MKTPLTYTKLHNYLLSTLLQKKFVRDYHKYCPEKRGHALIYYKTDGFTPAYRFNYAHTNTWEVVCIANILNRLGYWVDIIDRNIDASFQPDNKYDVFISDGAVDSTRHYAKYARHLTRAIKIYQAVNPNPVVRNARVEHRHQELERRTGQTMPLRRTVRQIDIQEEMAHTDYIFSVGNSVTNSTYDTFNKKLYKIFLSTYPKLSFDINAITAKQKNKFLFFSGDGNIFKGLDLAIEAFAHAPELELHVCTTIEDEFSKLYANTLDNSPNIHLEHFTMVGSPKFEELTNTCGFVTLLGCAEGTATSVLTCLRRGLIPVVTPETGLDVDGFGYLINSLEIPQLVYQYRQAAAMDDNEFTNRIIAAYHSSFQYTQETFEASFTDALLDVLLKENKI